MATFGLWTANFIVSQTFPMMDKNAYLVERFNHGFPFYVYGAFCAVLLCVVWWFVPVLAGLLLSVPLSMVLSSLALGEWRHQGS